MKNVFRQLTIGAVTSAFALSAFLGALPARADDSDINPATGVARLSYVSGDVAIRRGDANQTVAATVNAPVLGADYLRTGRGDSRAEVQFNGTSMVRVGENVEMRFLNLDPNKTEMQLAQGTVELREFRNGSERPQIDTPSISLRPNDRGQYRVAVASDGTTQVTVRSGAADIETPSGVQVLRPGQTLVARGDAAHPELAFQGSIAYDTFDEFNQHRDALDERVLADTYVAPAIDGGADLDQYGRWEPDQNYGHVWIPNDVPAGWAPYRNGNWAWENSYGWVWVGAEPWGWAPYHYGGWFVSPLYGWCWAPPAVALYARPVWRPAVVGFIGFGLGGGVSVGVGFGNVGWVALAPWETYHPWYGFGGLGFGRPFGGGFGFNRTNITNITNVNITNVYANAARPGAVTGISTKRFMLGRFDHLAAVPQSQLRAATEVRGALPVTPTANNLRFANRSVSPRIAGATTAFTDRHFAGTGNVVARTQFQPQRGAAAPTVSHLGGGTGSSFDRFSAAGRGGSLATGTRPATTTFAGRSAGQTGDAWSRFGAARGSTAFNGGSRVEHNASTPNFSARSTGTGQATNDAWSRFGGRSATTVNAGSRVERNASTPNISARSTGTGQATNDAWGRFGGRSATTGSSGSRIERNTSTPSYSTGGTRSYSPRSYGSSNTANSYGGSRSYNRTNSSGSSRSSSDTRWSGSNRSSGGGERTSSGSERASSGGERSGHSNR